MLLLLLGEEMNIKDIAKLAGVSVATVSRVINGNEQVKKESKDRIDALIKEHNYVPSSIGISMLKKKTNVIGIILPIIHSYYTERFNAISRILSENHYNTIVSVTSYKEKDEVKALSDFLKRQVDGVIFMTTKLTENHRDILNKYKNKTPLLVLDSDALDYGFSSIIHDDYSGAKEAVSYLISKGHKKIAFVSGGETNIYSSSLRYKAYVDLMLLTGLEKKDLLIVNGNYSMKSGYDAVNQLFLTETPKPTAIYCANDGMAIGVYRRLHELGYKIPEDVSVMGTDDIEPVKYLCPATLTTIKQELIQSGDLAANLILKYINNLHNKIETIMLKQTLVIRESVKDINNP